MELLLNICLTVFFISTAGAIFCLVLEYHNFEKRLDEE